MSDVRSSPSEQHDALNQPCAQPIADVKVALNRLKSEQRCTPDERREATSWLEHNAREIAAEDIARVGYVRALLRRAGLTEDLATARAAYFYAALVGAEQMIPHIDFPRASIENFIDAVFCPD